MTTPAAQRRYDALEALTRVAYGRPGTGCLLTVADVPTTATAIRTLAPLGRTLRWTNEVERWARAVESTLDPRGDDVPPEDVTRFLHWAFSQYSVYVSYAAE